MFYYNPFSYWTVTTMGKDIFTTMNCLRILSGIISCLIVGTLCQTVSIKEGNRSVLPSNATHKVNVNFTCIGSNPELGYYIKNGVIWRFTDVHGIEYNISQTFEPDLHNEYIKAKFNNKSFIFEWEEQRTQGQTIQQFILQIIGVTHSDSGKYTCAHNNQTESIIDKKQVTLTVVNPVEFLTLELLDSNGISLAKSESETSNSEIIKRAGKYMVKCTAQNSNPKPDMRLFLDDIEVQVTVSHTQQNSTFSRFTGILEELIQLSPHDSVHVLQCTAGIQPPELDQMKTAEIKVLTPMEKPIVSCTNLSAYNRDNNKKIECNLTAASEFSSLTCDEVRWQIANINQYIAHEEMWTDGMEEYGRIATRCHVVIPQQKLHVTLEFYSLKEVHFKAVYFVTYGMGDSASKHALEIYNLVEPTSASQTLQLTMLAYVSMTIVVSKQLIRYL